MAISARAARATVIDLWREAHGAAPRALMVGPAPVTPFTRVFVIDAGDHYRSGIFRWPRELRFDPAAVPKNDHLPAAQRARATAREIQAFLVWSRFPFWIVESTPAGTRVTAADMRFPEAARAPDARFVGRAMLPP
jgi:hypothetical protein